MLLWCTQVILGSRYGTPVDMWSLGCIVAELVTGRPLFAGCDESDQLTSQLEYLGMPPVQLLAKSTRAGEFFSTTTNLPRYCTLTVRQLGLLHLTRHMWFPIGGPL